MSYEFTSSIVSIINKREEIVGAGFLVSKQYVLTCAHVVAQALGIQKSMPDTPLDKVYIKFPFSHKGINHEQRIATGSIIIWRPVSEPLVPGSDIAMIKLESDPPSGSKPCVLIESNDLWEHRFRAFGFPGAHNEGVFATGIIRDRLANGWVQVEDIKSTGYFLEPGFSGTPVWDEKEKGVVGMVVASEQISNIRAAFIIPAALLLDVCGEFIPKNISIKIMRKVLNFRIALVIFLSLALLLMGSYLGFLKSWNVRDAFKAKGADISGHWIYRSPPENKNYEEWHIKQTRNGLLIRSTILNGEKGREFSGDYSHDTGRFSYSFEVPMTTGPAEIVNGKGKIDDTGRTIAGIWECLGLSDDFILVRAE